jgi:hypothetical protein
MTGGGKSERLVNCRAVRGDKQPKQLLYSHEHRPGLKMRTDAFVWKRTCANRHTKKDWPAEARERGRG